MKKHYEVIIIGSGIAGMTAAIYLKRGGVSPLIIEESAPGGQLNKVNVIENYPGFEETDGPSLAFDIYNQIKMIFKDNEEEQEYAINYFCDILLKGEENESNSNKR